MSKQLWVDDVLLKVYVKGKYNLPEIINVFVICVVLMVLDTSLYKVLSWWFMGLIKSELYCLGIRIHTKKKKNYCLYRSRTNYIRLNNLHIKKTIGAKLSRFAIYIEAICCGSLINFVVVAVFINCSNS